MSDHERWADAAGAYVLGAMAPAERDEFERHLAVCAICREEVDELRPAAEALPLASPPAGRVYAVWVVPEGERAPRPTNVLFLPRSNGSAQAAIPGDASDIAEVLVTDEPPGGSDTPTGEVVMEAELS